MDQDLVAIQQARDLVRRARAAKEQFMAFTQQQVDAITKAMADAGERAAGRLGRHAHEETGFGRPESKKVKNLFATKMLYEALQDLKTVGIIRKTDGGRIWEIAVPMGVVAALIPSTNPTSTALYKAIIAAKARCGIVMSPHPRAVRCTEAALKVVADAAYKAGAPKGLFGCMSSATLAGTNALLEHAETDVILATGGGAMVRAAYSKGKPAYGVGSGNVPMFVDRSADVEKAARDLLYGTSFDWGTLCSTERSVVVDYPVKARLIKAMKSEGAYFCTDAEKDLLRATVAPRGRLNIKQVGQSPHAIASMAGFAVPEDTRALVAEVDAVGRKEPLSMETLSPILSFYTADGWQAGCARCIEVLHYGGIGHTLALHCNSETVIEAFGLQKPSMRIVVNTVAALGSVGYTTGLFPAMTLGPGTLGGSITSDNISPMHLLNIKRLAFETKPVHASAAPAAKGRKRTTRMEEIEARLLARAGNPPHQRSTPQGQTDTAAPKLSEARIDALVRKYRR